MTTFSYLACPYWHPDQQVRLARFQAITIISGKLLREGVVNFSPITHGQMQKDYCPSVKETEGNHTFWMNADLPFMHASQSMIEVRFPGWEESMGLQFERKFFIDQKKSIHYLNWQSYVAESKIIHNLKKAY